MRLRAVVSVLLSALLGLATACSAGPGTQNRADRRPGASPSSARSAPSTSGSPSTSERPTTSGRPSTPGPPRPPGRPRVVGTAARNLQTPWGVTFLPDGTALVGERDTARVVAIKGGRVRTVGRVPGVTPQGEAGLLGLANSPSYATDRLIYAYLTTARDNRVVTMRYDGGRLGPPRPILTGIPNGFVHDGGRLLFGSDGNLFVSTGETGDGSLAQDPRSLGGKILRITPQGRAAPGNPVKGSPVWSPGHRNVQGLAFDGSGRLWASEFGQDAWDELNLIVKGGNYGWPVVEGRGSVKRFRNPAVQWRPAVASPAGLAYLDGSLWVGALRGSRLWQVPLRNGKATKPRAFFVGRYGRLRTVVVAPDGNLWVTTSNRDSRGDPRPGDDRILVVAPR